MKYILIIFLTFTLLSCNKSALEDGKPIQEKGTQTQKNTTVTPPLSDYKDILNATPEKIRNAPEFNACMQTNISQCVQSSAMEIAQKNKSTEFCEELTIPEQKESCKFAVIVLDIQTGGDINRCESLAPSFRDTCINQSHQNNALKTKDIKVCDNISVSKDPGSTNNRTRCIMNVIMSDEKSKEADCKKIGDAILESMCKSSISQRAKK